MTVGVVSGSRETRVVDAQRQAAATLRSSVAFAVAAPVSALRGGDLGSWLPLHLFLVGGLLTAISGATQLLAVTWSASPAPADSRVAAQRWAVAIGAALVIVGRWSEVTSVTAIGGCSVLVGIALLAANLWSIRRSSGNHRFHPAIEGYEAAMVAALIGVGLGISLAVSEPGPGWGRTRDAHVTLNTLGLVGLVIAATLPFFVATQARTKMSAAASPPAMRAAVGTMAAAVAVAAGGQFAGVASVAAAGHAVYVVALVRVATLLPPLGRRQLRWAGPRLVQLVAGTAWWAVGVAALGLGQVVDELDTSRALRVVVVGGFAQILVASLAYLGPVIRGGGHERLAAGFAATRSWASLLLGNGAALALAAGADPLAAVLLVWWAAVVAAAALRLGGWSAAFSVSPS